MSVDIVMPRLSDSMEEGTVLSWMKSVGDEVALGEELVEIETDKANMVFESDAAGTLIEIVADGGRHAADRRGDRAGRRGGRGAQPASGRASRRGEGRRGREQRPARPLADTRVHAAVPLPKPRRPRSRRAPPLPSPDPSTRTKSRETDA